MFLFMLILVPAFLVFFCLRSKDKAAVLLAVSGAAAGVVVCVVLAVFFFMHRVPEDSFPRNFLHYFCREYALPPMALYAAYFFMTKDGAPFRVRAFFPLCGGFLSIYMPYFILFSAQPYCSFFELFAKPVLFLAMLLISANALYGIFRAVTEGSRSNVLVCALILAAACAVPPALNACWLLKLLPGVLLYAACAAYAAFGAFLFVLALRREECFFL
ncbi:MAG: hypothetical protein K2H09_06860 [Treponemataceae bacterium]|nr:hypothetical protein [Treponemataceae bacterium]